MTSTNQKQINAIAEQYDREQSAILNEFFTFLRFQSVSSEAAYKPELLACCDWLAAKVKGIGFHVEKWETHVHPIIFATNLEAGPDQPTLLIYSHYDVQPVDPLEEWTSPPFEPTIREGEIYARGAQDNKGQCFYVFQALRILKEIHGKLPINIKWIIEGEEECGSAGLAAIIPKHTADLKADYLAIIDLMIRAPNKPSITLGIRGLTTMDVEVRGTHTDLHSGLHGGMAYNPIRALAEVLAKVFDSNGHVVIPGFYEDLEELTESDYNQLALDFVDADYQKMFGAKPTGGERDLPVLIRNWLRPTFEINGITGGYSGTGFKTVIPAKASAKVSCRLVSHQNPAKVAAIVKNYIEKSAPEGTTIHVRIHEGGGPAVRTGISSRVVQAFAKSLEEVFQSPCEYILEGGSIPVVAALQKASQSEVLLFGLGLPDDAIHAPNEHFGVDRLRKGCLTVARGIELLQTTV